MYASSMVFLLQVQFFDCCGKVCSGGFSGVGEGLEEAGTVLDAGLQFCAVPSVFVGDAGEYG